MKLYDNHISIFVIKLFKPTVYELSKNSDMLINLGKDAFLEPYVLHTMH